MLALIHGESTLPLKLVGRSPVCMRELHLLMLAELVSILQFFPLDFGFILFSILDVQAGLGRAINSFPTVEVVAKELDVVGSVRYTAGCFQTAIGLVASGKVNLKPLITAVFPLSRSAEALEAVRKGEDLKVIIMNQQV